MAIRSNFLRAVLCCLAPILLAGCGAVEYTKEAHVQGVSETVVLHSDATYDQTVTCASGQTLLQQGEWLTTSPAHQLGVPVKPSDIPDVMTRDRLRIPACCTPNSKLGATEAMMFEPKTAYRESPETDNRSAIQSAVLILAIILLSGTGFGVYTIFARAAKRMAEQDADV
jgi:hypothetical protein